MDDAWVVQKVLTQPHWPHSCFCVQKGRTSVLYVQKQGLVGPFVFLSYYRKQYLPTLTSVSYYCTGVLDVPNEMIEMRLHAPHRWNHAVHWHWHTVALVR